MWMGQQATSYDSVTDGFVTWNAY